MIKYISSWDIAEGKIFEGEKLNAAKISGFWKDHICVFWKCQRGMILSSGSDPGANMRGNDPESRHNTNNEWLQLIQSDHMKLKTRNLQVGIIYECGRKEKKTYSGEFRLRPNVVKSLPNARCTIPGSVSAALINVNRPIIPNWSVTIPWGMLVTRPG